MYSHETKAWIIYIHHKNETHLWFTHDNKINKLLAWLSNISSIRGPLTEGSTVLMELPSQIWNDRLQKEENNKTNKKTACVKLNFPQHHYHYYSGGGGFPVLFSYLFTFFRFWSKLASYIFQIFLIYVDKQKTRWKFIDNIIICDSKLGPEKWPDFITLSWTIPMCIRLTFF